MKLTSHTYIKILIKEITKMNVIWTEMMPYAPLREKDVDADEQEQRQQKASLKAMKRETAMTEILVLVGEDENDFTASSVQAKKNAIVEENFADYDPTPDFPMEAYPAEEVSYSTDSVEEENVDFYSGEEY
jgi:hypothetical protein